MKATIWIAALVFAALGSRAMALADCYWPVPPAPTYTDDFYFEASSAKGAPGAIVGVDLTLTIEALHSSRLSAMVLVASYDPAKAELLGEPVYAERFWDFAWAPFFATLGAPEGLAGFLSAASFVDHDVADPPPGMVGEPIPIGTVYFRLFGAPGERFQVQFADDVLFGSTTQCERNHLYFSSPDLQVYSTRHVAGTVTIVEPGDPAPDPELPPAAKIYPDAPTPEAAAARYELTGATGAPGDIVAVDFSITSSLDFVGYSMGGRYPPRYLELEGIDVHTTPGVELISNERGEFGIYSTSGTRRMGTEGEGVDAATLRFRVLPAAAALDEVTISLEDLSIPEAPAQSYVNALTILYGGGAIAHVPATTEVSPIELAGAVVAIRPAAGMLRGDGTADGAVDTADAMATLRHLFLGGAAPECPNAADFNQDGRLNVTDPIALLGVLFLGHREVGDLPETVACE